jgi:hypothetical protein
MLWHVISLVLIAFGAYVAAVNWYIVVIRQRIQRKSESWIPLVGGISGCAGCLLSPLESIRICWWVPLLIDWGTLPGFTVTAIYWYKYFQGASRNKHDHSDGPGIG